MMQALTAQRYDRLSERYDRSHARWLRYEGGEAQCAFEGAVTALLKPGLSVLDAACGTGVVARRLLAGAGRGVDFTLLDASPEMLSRCADIPAERVLGRLEALPFPSAQFDMTTCAWGVEASDDPTASLAELARVTRPGGRLCIVFCAARPVRTLLGHGLRYNVSAAGLGRFLDVRDVVEALGQSCNGKAQTLHCSGPAAAVLARV